MNKESMVFRAIIIGVIAVSIAMSIAISGCIENPNTKHNTNDISDNFSDNISDNPNNNISDTGLNDNGLNSAYNFTNNSNTNNSNNNLINNPSNSYNVTTGTNKNNIIVFITVSNNSLPKISVKNVEIYSKFYGWKTLDKQLNQSIYTGNLPAGKYDKIRIGINESSTKYVFEIQVNFSLNETGQISINMSIGTETDKMDNLLPINVSVYENLNLTASKIFMFEITANNSNNKTKILDCQSSCEAMCNEHTEEKCRNNTNINNKINNNINNTNN